MRAWRPCNSAQMAARPPLNNGPYFPDPPTVIPDQVRDDGLLLTFGAGGSAPPEWFSLARYVSNAVSA
ncbi:MAG: hypothetical protein ACI8S3_002548 [Alphaproteobacteria bacterium]|jgi:hypothetical protein